MKLGKMLSFGEVAEHAADEPALVAETAETAETAVEITAAPSAEVERPAPVPAHADR